MDRLEAMSILVATVETGSFSAAGRKLNMPLATVSRKVADLEAHLGARLLIRSTRKLTLTATGPPTSMHANASSNRWATRSALWRASSARRAAIW